MLSFLYRCVCLFGTHLTLVTWRVCLGAACFRVLLLCDPAACSGSPAAHGPARHTDPRLLPATWAAAFFSGGFITVCVFKTRSQVALAGLIPKPPASRLPCCVGVCHSYSRGVGWTFCTAVLLGCRDHLTLVHFLALLVLLTEPAQRLQATFACLCLHFRLPWIAI